MKRGGPLKRRTPLCPISRKHCLSQIELAANYAIRRQMSGGWCELQLPGCTGRGDGPHHLKKRSQGGGQGGGHEVDNLRDACSVCNGWVEDNPLEAEALGFVIRRNPTPTPAPQSITVSVDLKGQK